MPNNDKKVYVEFEMSPGELPIEICQTLWFHGAEELTAHFDWEKNTMLVETEITQVDASGLGWDSGFEERVVYVEPDDDESEEDDSEED